MVFLAVFLVSNDFTAFHTSLPIIEKHFAIDVAMAHWIVNAYTLVFGVSIVTSGILGDVFGRKRILLIGVVIFATFSFLGATAKELWVLILARAFIGLGGALIWAAGIGMAYSLMPRNRAGLAGGLILMVSGLTNAVGPIIGGIFSEYLSWRWILFANIIIAVLVVLSSWKKCLEGQTYKLRRKIDYLGVFTLSMATFFVLLVMDMVVEVGVGGSVVISMLALSFIFFSAFTLVEFWAKDNALIPINLLTNRGFITAALSMLFCAIAFFATLVYIPHFFIKIFGFTALQAGFALLPLMITSGIFALVSGFLHAKVGAKVLICGGALGMCIGFFMLSSLGDKANYINFVPGLLLMGISIGIYSPAIITAAITSVDPSESSLAGAIIYMFKFIGGALGLGVNASIIAASPEIVIGIYRAFYVDAFLSLIGFAVSMLLISSNSQKNYRA